MQVLIYGCIRSCFAFLFQLSYRADQRMEPAENSEAGSARSPLLRMAGQGLNPKRSVCILDAVASGESLEHSEPLFSFCTIKKIESTGMNCIELRL